MKVGDNVWWFDARTQTIECSEAISVNEHGGIVYTYDKAFWIGREAFSTREALCKHYRKIFDMNEELVSMEGLTDREIQHKMLDKILDTDGAKNSAIWMQCFPDFVGHNSRLVKYRLHIDIEKTVTKQ